MQAPAFHCTNHRNTQIREKKNLRANSGLISICHLHLHLSLSADTAGRIKPKFSFFTCLQARRSCWCRLLVCLFWLKRHTSPKCRACAGRRQLSGSTVRRVHDILFPLKVLQNRNMTFYRHKQTKNRMLKNKPNHNRDQRKNGEENNSGKQRGEEKGLEDAVLRV